MCACLFKRARARDSDSVERARTHHRLLGARRGFLRRELLEGEAGRAFRARLGVNVQIASLRYEITRYIYRQYHTHTHTEVRLETLHRHPTIRQSSAGHKNRQNPLWIRLRLRNAMGVGRAPRRSTEDRFGSPSACR